MFDFRSQVQREREETRECITSEVKIMQGQIEGTATDLMDCLKKEKVDRERGTETVKRRIEEEKQELQQNTKTYILKSVLIFD